VIIEYEDITLRAIEESDLELLKEMINDPEYKIGRPRQLYVGPARRDVIPVDQR